MRSRTPPGDRETALPLIEEALAPSATTGKRLAYVELHRLRAEMLLRRSGSRRRARSSRREPSQAAEEALDRALSVARAQGARWFELRAATDLARLWSRSGRIGQARALLASTLDGYPDELELPDVREARELRASVGDE